MTNNNNKGMGILKLERKNNNTFCSIKTYNENLSGNYILGMKLNNRIIKQNINLENNIYNFISQEIKDLDELQGCVLIQLHNGEFSPILWGNNRDKNYKANIVNSLRQSVNNISNSKIKEQTKGSFELSDKTTTEEPKTNNQNNNKTEVILDKDISTKNPSSLLSEYTTETNNKPLNQIKQNKEEHLSFKLNNNTHNENNNLSIKKISKLTSQQHIFNNEYAYHPIKNCNNCKAETLSKISLEEEPISNNNMPEIAISCNTANLFESNDDEVENLIDNEMKNKYNSNHNFYNMIKEQLDELFDRYPPEENLNKLIDNSFWVKINTDTDNRHYVVGIIKNEEDIKYICYGVPGNYNIEPPMEMKDYSQWLPTDIKDPYNNGYWVMYQDADTGENIFIN